MKHYIPQAWKEQWSKPMFSFFDYIPTKYTATDREQKIRKMIWQFKGGKLHKEVARLVAARITEKFGSFAMNVVFVCIPASSAEKNEIRYREFCEEVSQYCGCINGYNAVKVEGSRMSIHEHHNGKEIRNTETVTLNNDFFNGKQVIVFDDVLTRGRSYAQFATAIEMTGAEVLGGIFLGKTKLFN